MTLGKENQHRELTDRVSVEECIQWIKHLDVCCKGAEADSVKIKVIELLKKQVPSKPDYEGDGYSDGALVYDTWICPGCGKRYEIDYDDYEYCPNCGQRLDLSEVTGFESC